MIARSDQLSELALGMLEPGSILLDVARRAGEATNSPVIGGVAVFLHGYRRTTQDVDLLVQDAAAARDALEAIGAVWSDSERGLILDGVPIHLVTTQLTREHPTRTSTIAGIPTVPLSDLVRIKLRSGLGNLERAKDLADVVELVRRVPLDASFAARLPPDLRADFHRIVTAVKKADPSS